MTMQVMNQNSAVIVGNSFNESLAADWLAFNADKSAATVKTYDAAIKNFLCWLSDNEIKNPRREDVIAYRQQLCSTKKISTARLYTTAVKVFSKWLASNGLYLDFAAGVGTPKLDEEAETHSREALTLDEAKAVLNSFKGSDVKTMRDKLILRLMLNCGLRSIEITRLDTTDIEKRHKKIFLKIWGKGRSGKTSRVEISQNVYMMILDYLNARGAKFTKGEPMFTSTANRNFGQRIQPQSVSKITKKTFRSVGIDTSTITCHSCRHFCATEMLLQGVDIARVQKILRHKNQSTTQIYRHDLEMKADNSVQIISDLLDCA